MTETKKVLLKDVLIAIAEGKEIQCKKDTDTNWVTATPNMLKTLNPLSSPSMDWRIKPDPMKEAWDVIKDGEFVKPLPLIYREKVKNLFDYAWTCGYSCAQEEHNNGV